MELTWPPDLDMLKADLRSRGERVEDLEGDTEQLEMVLAAAVVKVEHIRAGDFDFGTGDDGDDDLPRPGPDLVLGAIRLAGRWHVRRRSPDGMVQMAQEMGATRVASFDPDIDRLLGIGRYRGPVVA